MTTRLADIPRLFLGNDLVNTFPQKQTQTHQWYYNGGMVFSVVCSMVVAVQWCSKHISVAMNPPVMIEEMCFLCGPCQDVISLVSSVWESVKRGLEPRGRGIAIVGTVTRKRLVTD
jgi:hypothetical protein